MKHPHSKKPVSRHLGSIRRDEVLPLSEVALRMGWADQMTSDVQVMGLPTAKIGRRKYCTGDAVYKFVERMMQQSVEK